MRSTLLFCNRRKVCHISCKCRVRVAFANSTLQASANSSARGNTATRKRRTKTRAWSFSMKSCYRSATGVARPYFPVDPRRTSCQIHRIISGGPRVRHRSERPAAGASRVYPRITLVLCREVCLVSSFRCICLYVLTLSSTGKTRHESYERTAHDPRRSPSDQSRE